MILITVNFIVITKGATRIAEVGARFTLDAIPGKQMAIDADLSAGLIDDKEAQRRRRELEEESSFFGSMDGASKFVRGDAIAGLIITAVNIFGGIIIGVTRHGMSLGEAADVFIKLSVGDGLVTQIPALIVSLAAGLLVSKGGTRGSTDKAVFGQLGDYPRALFVAAGAAVRCWRSCPGLPFLPFAVLGGVHGLRRLRHPARAAPRATAARGGRSAQEADARPTRRTQLGQGSRSRPPRSSCCLGKQLSTRLLRRRTRNSRTASARCAGSSPRSTASSCPRSSSPTTSPSRRRAYQIKIHGTVVADAASCASANVLVITGDGRTPDVPGEEVREPAFGMKARVGARRCSPRT